MKEEKVLIWSYVKNVTRRVREIRADFGWGEVLLLAISRRPFDVLVVVRAMDVMCLASRRFEPRVDPEVDVRRLETDDLPDLLECARLEPRESERELRSFFASGARSYGAYVAGRLAGYCFVFSDQYVLGEGEDHVQSALRLGLERGSGFIGNVFVLTEHRQRGIYRLLLTMVLEDLGGEALYSSTSYTNFVSRKAHRRLGFHPIGLMAWIAWLGRGGGWYVAGAGRRLGRVAGDREVVELRSVLPIDEEESRAP